MSLEIEQNFYNFDIADIRSKLTKLGAKKKVYLFKVYESYSKEKKQSIRLRDEGHRITFTIKKLKNKSKPNNKYDREYEINISDFDMAKQMLEILGVDFDLYYEKIREAYYYKNSEIAIDYVPGVITFLQIESKTEPELFSVATKLGLNLEEGKPVNSFEFYGINEDKFYKLPGSFDNIKDMKKMVTKHKKEYNELTRNQMNMYREVVS